MTASPIRKPMRIATASSIFSVVACLAAACLFASGAAAWDGRDADSRRALERRVDRWTARALPELLGVYRHLHANPELSLEEAKTSALVATVLKKSGYSVSTGIGGFGVVGILENGDGPTLLLRGDMDALPVTEATGLDYASEFRAKNAEGVEVGVMHACGHDVHVTNLLGTAQLLSDVRDAWRGTLVVLAQPAEELGLGALRMIEDGLFERIPRPDHGLALHVAAELPAGTIGFVSGWAAANVDWVKITMIGRGGHGARPHEAVDPIVMSAHLITTLQTIVSRSIGPGSPAVVTVGSIHGGAKSNVIPDEVVLDLTVRSYSDEVRDTLLESIGRMARETCHLFDCPKAPVVWIKPDYTPAMWNDPDLVAHGVEVFEAMLGPSNVREIEATMTGEDFGRYTRSGDFPTFLYRLGAAREADVQASETGGDPLPSLHSSRFSPDAEPTISTGIRSMARLALSLLSASEAAAQ